MILRPIVHSKIGCGKLFPELYPQKNLDDINADAGMHLQTSGND
jgi:hypothetical protein